MEQPDTTNACFPSLKFWRNIIGVPFIIVGIQSLNNKQPLQLHMLEGGPRSFPTSTQTTARQENN
jgi:hypothetical protein